MDDQFEQGTSRQAWKAATGQATHNHGRQGYAGTVGMASGGLALY
jgi:hypothetical protein